MQNRYIFFVLLLYDWQEVAVKEQLMGKGKLYRRSLSSPNVNRVSILCWHLQYIEGSKSSLSATDPYDARVMEHSNKFPSV